ncbi:MAG: hypothetical protein AAF840_07840 [Bacteroidota bacterium]
MAGSLTIHCLLAGGGSFLVDRGRPGRQALGIASGGPADRRARDAANRLLDQDKHTTCLELTLTGGKWLLSGEGQFVLTGADMNWRLNGRLLEAYTVQYLDGDGLLTSTAAVKGIRAYLGIQGRWSVPQTLGSAEAGLPGVPNISPGWETTVHWQQEAPYTSDLDTHQHFHTQPVPLTVIPGPEWNWLTENQQADLLSNPFFISAQSSRQGIRLDGPANNYNLPSLISSPVIPGTVQLTPSGPIILGPDAQTVGGYPRVLLIPEPETLSTAFQTPIGGTVALQIR